ncbi:MAG: hypothetical protein KGL39_31175 [Patescibacteria group bacterium]|nr:hypothetical protein [Patescibacteria group bacterium]
MTEQFDRERAVADYRNQYGHNAAADFFAGWDACASAERERVRKGAEKWREFCIIELNQGRKAALEWLRDQKDDA